MNKLFASFALGVLALCASGLAQAEKADRTKPANIEADALRHDDLKQTSVFTGNVVMTKGTIIIRGARLEVRQDAEGYQYGTVWADTGKRAYFKQKRDTAAGAPDEFIEGEGETIEYDGRADNVKFIRRAEMRRLAGNTVDDDVRGDVIVYNNITDVFTVDGNKQNDTKASPGGRVRAVLSPRGDGPGAKPAATPPAGTAAPALRQSTTLDGAPQ